MDASSFFEQQGVRDLPVFTALECASEIGRALHDALTFLLASVESGHVSAEAIEIAKSAIAHARGEAR